LSNNNLPKGPGRTFESCWAGQLMEVRTDHILYSSYRSHGLQLPFIPMHMYVCNRSKELLVDCCV